jgi:hypothetical protein
MAVLIFRFNACSSEVIQYYSDDNIEKSEMGGAWERHVQGFGGET